MIDLFSIKDVSRIFGLREARLRYWVSSGFLWPSVRRGGRFFYTFEDLITVKTAVGLLEGGVPMKKVRAALQALRSELPAGVSRGSRLRIVSDGDEVVIVDDGIVYEPQSGQVVMAFAVSSLESQIADVIPMPESDATLGAVPETIDEMPGDTTQPQEMPSGYRLFLDGCRAEDAGDVATAERCYRQCLVFEPSLAAAHTNLGNILHADGRSDEARTCYEHALELDPDQPEARFNLGNILDELGETELAIAELRQVVTRAPEFADAHYNLGLILARVGGVAQAAQHLGTYLDLDPKSDWASRARQILEQVA